MTGDDVTGNRKIRVLSSSNNYSVSFLLDWYSFTRRGSRTVTCLFLFMYLYEKTGYDDIHV